MGAILLRVSVFLLVLIEHMVVSFTCNPSRPIKCPSEDKCIPLRWICDGGDDCSDKSDESFCKQESITCPDNEFQCSSGACKPRVDFCNGVNNCGDNSDEFYCENSFDSRMTVDVPCPRNWIRCSKGCIQGNWKCNGVKDCPDGSDESGCPSATPPPTRPPSRILTTRRISIRNESREEEKAPVQRPPSRSPSGFPSGSPSRSPSRNPPRSPPSESQSDSSTGFLDAATAKGKGIAWLLGRRKPEATNNRWGSELHRIATVLYLADERFFAPGNATGEEIGYELTIQLLHKLSGNGTMRSQELALYIQALTVTCSDPTDFFSRNLVKELRKKVDSSNYTNPFEILVLCIAKDSMSSKDYQRVTIAFDSQYRPFWTDTQAIATMALQCLSTSPNVRVDEDTITDFHDELKKRQYKNGTVHNTITTALVIQALQSKESYKEYFDLQAALAVLKDNQQSDGSWGSVRNSYYVLPAILNKSYLNISSNHCIRRQETEEEALQKLQDASGDKFVVQYSVWIGNDVDLGRTWRIRMKTSRDNTFYDVIETVRKLDSKHNVTYSVIENKPYVYSLYGKEDDPEMGLYWFTYVQSLLKLDGPKLIEASPVDVRIFPKQELILWYRGGIWSANENPRLEKDY